MVKRLRFWLSSAVLVASIQTAAAAQEAPSLPPDLVKKIEEVVASEQARLKIPGLSVAVGTGGQLRYSRGFGMADLENSVPARATTLYRTASIAKPITASAVMQLSEQGKLDLDAPIQKYCPTFPEKPWPITARQLLGHLGGIRHYKAPGESAGTSHYFTISDSLKIFKDEPLLHEPGTKFNYTTYGYSVLGCAIEGASGNSYDVYLSEHLFKPARMERTRTDHHFLLITERTRGYQKLSQQIYDRLPASLKAQVAQGAIINASLHDTSMKVPGGGLVSTPVDLVRFVLAMHDGTLVKKSTLDQMWISQKTKDGKETGYGLGWGVRQDGSIKLISHSGGQAGTSTLLTYSPEHRIVIAIMSNLQEASLGEMAKAIADAILAK
jgi:serine beta-lactamase-like protein LACTB